MFLHTAFEIGIQYVGFQSQKVKKEDKQPVDLTGYSVSFLRRPHKFDENFHFQISASLAHEMK